MIRTDFIEARAGIRRLGLSALGIFILVSIPTAADAAPSGCKKTAKLLLSACKKEAFSDYFIALANARNLADGEALDLTVREFALLEYLAMRKGQVVSRTEIESHIYDDRVEAMSNVVDSAVYHLRRKIDRPGRPSMIRTRRGMGYVLQNPSEENSTAAGGQG